MILAHGDHRRLRRLPDAAIAKNSHLLRPLGLGYANLGALAMLNGLAYDSDEGRNLAAAITSLMCGRAYRRSAEIASRVGRSPSTSATASPSSR